MSDPLYRHVCEVCGKTEDLTSEQGFEQGWDYPPRMGIFGVVSPRPAATARSTRRCGGG